MRERIRPPLRFQRLTDDGVIQVRFDIPFKDTSTAYTYWLVTACFPCTLQLASTFTVDLRYLYALCTLRYALSLIR